MNMHAVVSDCKCYSNMIAKLALALLLFTICI